MTSIFKAKINSYLYAAVFSFGETEIPRIYIEIVSSPSNQSSFGNCSYNII